jgi:hypothetical protein
MDFSAFDVQFGILRASFINFSMYIEVLVKQKRVNWSFQIYKCEDVDYGLLGCDTVWSIFRVMEAIHSSRTLVTTYKTTQYNNPNHDQHLIIYHYSATLIV